MDGANFADSTPFVFQRGNRAFNAGLRPATREQEAEVRPGLTAKATASNPQNRQIQQYSPRPLAARLAVGCTCRVRGRAALSPFFQE